MPNLASSIFLNDTIFSHVRQRGVSRYAQEIFAEAIAQFGSKAVVFSSYPGDYNPAKHIRPLRFRGSQRFRLHDILASFFARRERARVIYSSYYGYMWANAAEVFTVYDMVHETFPQYFPDSHRFVAEKKHCFNRAAALIAISHSTANDIGSYYPEFDLTKVEVIHLGVDEFFFQQNQRRCGEERPYFLYVGHRNHHKNFQGLLVAFGRSGLKKEFDLRVLSPAGAGFTWQEMELIEKYRLQNTVQLISGASDEKLRESYANSVALVYPSKYEGFGLPILEAMASGTLVATSNISSMPEIGGDVAFYFNPSEPESIAACLGQVADLPVAKRQECIVLGRVRAKTFSWDRCRQQTIELFRKVM